MPDDQWASAAWRALSAGSRLLNAGPVASLSLPANVGEPIGITSSGTHVITSGANGLYAVPLVGGAERMISETDSDWIAVAGDRMLGVTGTSVRTIRVDSGQESRPLAGNTEADQATIVVSGDKRQLLAIWNDGVTSNEVEYAVTTTAARSWQQQGTLPMQRAWTSVANNGQQVASADATGTCGVEYRHGNARTRTRLAKWPRHKRYIRDRWRPCLLVCWHR